MSNKQKLAFRKDYEQDFDGSTSYSYRNSFPTNTPEFSLYLFSVPTVDGTRNVMFSCGDSSTVLFEVGVSTNDILFVYDGVTETEVGSVLVSGVAYYVTLVYLNELLTVYINNELYATGLGLGDVEGIDVVVGDSVAGGDYYEGYLNNVFLFVKEHDRQTASVVTGYGTTPAWTPEDLFVGAGGTWLDASDASYLTRATQPALLDGDMEAAGTGDWIDFLRVTGSKVAGSPGGSGSQVLHLEHTGANGTVYTRQLVLIDGNEYYVEGLARSDGTYAPTVVFHSTSSSWIGSASAAWQSIDYEGTALGTAFYLGSQTTNTTGGEWYEFDNIVLTNLSITAATPRAGTITDDFEQATAANQPWESSSAINFDEDDSLIYSGSNGDYKFLHYSETAENNYPEFTISLMIQLDSIPTIAGILFTDEFRLYISTGRKFTLYTEANSGYIIENLLSTDTLVLGEKSILTIVSSGGNCTYYLNGSSSGSQSYANTPKDANPASPLSIGNYASFDFYGQIGDLIIMNRGITTIERNKLESFLASKWGITL